MNAPTRDYSTRKLGDEPRESTRGAMNPVADQSNWRLQLRPDYVKFDDERKQRFLEELLKHGKRALAAKAADVSMQTVRNHLKIDPEFEELFNQTLLERADRVTSQLEQEALDGFQEPIYHAKTGELLGHKQVFETPIRLAILKRYDPEYKDRSETVHTGQVGVLVAPAQTSPEDWIADQEAKNTQRSEPDRDNLDAPAAARTIEHAPARPPADDPS